MSFPQVQRIVYSTCSIHDLENEGVVAAALGQTLAIPTPTHANPTNIPIKIPTNNEPDVSRKDTTKADENETNDSTDWELILPESLSQWKRRGNAVYGLTETQAKCLIRCSAEDGDETNGFFVSCFERKHSNHATHATHASTTTNHATKDDAPSSTFMDFLYRDEKVTLPIYQGEYQNKHGVEKDEKEICHSNPSNENVISTCVDGDGVATGSSFKPPSKSKQIPLSNNTTKSNTKKEKALLWKKRQREKKEMRLKNKKRKEHENDS